MPSKIRVIVTLIVYGLAMFVTGMNVPDEFKDEAATWFGNVFSSSETVEDSADVEEPSNSSSEISADESR